MELLLYRNKRPLAFISGIASVLITFWFKRYLYDNFLFQGNQKNIQFSVISRDSFQGFHFFCPINLNIRQWSLSFFIIHNYNFRLVTIQQEIGLIRIFTPFAFIIRSFMVKICFEWISTRIEGIMGFGWDKITSYWVS